MQSLCTDDGDWRWSPKTSKVPQTYWLRGSLPSKHHPLLPLMVEHIQRAGMDLDLELELWERLVCIRPTEMTKLFKQVSKLAFHSRNPPRHYVDTPKRDAKFTNPYVYADNCEPFVAYAFQAHLKLKRPQTASMMIQHGTRGCNFGVFFYWNLANHPTLPTSTNLNYTIAFCAYQGHYKRVHLVSFGTHYLRFYPLFFDISCARDSSSASSSASPSASSRSIPHTDWIRTHMEIRTDFSAPKLSQCQTFPLNGQILERRFPFYAGETSSGTATICDVPVVYRHWNTLEPGVPQSKWPQDYWNTMEWHDRHQHEALAPRVGSNGETWGPFIVYQSHRFNMDVLYHTHATKQSKLRVTLILLSEVSQGVAYLHSIGQTHGRLSTSTITVDNYHPLIIDYDNLDQSKARIINIFTQRGYTMDQPAAPINLTDAFLAPEIFEVQSASIASLGLETNTTSSSDLISPAADVFSFGLILWFTFHGIFINRVTFEDIYSGNTPEWRASSFSVSDSLKSLYSSCVNIHPADRPTMEEVGKIMATIVQEYREPSYPKRRLDI